MSARWLLLLFMASGCAAADDVQFIRAAPETAEAISLLGDTLRRPPLSVEDGQRLVNDCNEITKKITKSFSNGWPASGGGT